MSASATTKPINPYDYKYDENNVFAKILRKEVPAKIVYEDEFVIAFPDIKPKAKTHILVVPKARFVHLNHMVLDGIKSNHAGFIRGIYMAAAAAGVAEKGYRVQINVGEGGGQEVPHLHAHILAD